MERNSRDFVSRIDRINSGAEAICEVLQAHPRGKYDPNTLSWCSRLWLTAAISFSQASVLSKIQLNSTIL